MAKNNHLLLPFYQENSIEAGIDEAGRGCYAGPVFAAAVILPKNFYHPLLNDSKLLVKKQKNITLIPFNGKHGEGFTTLSNDKYINEISLFLLKIGF